VSSLSAGAKAALDLWLRAIWWDLVCPPRQTISEAIARGIADPRTRVFVGSIVLITTFHLFALARKVDE
jgi:hypothetical protein